MYKRVLAVLCTNWAAFPVPAARGGPALAKNLHAEAAHVRSLVNKVRAVVNHGLLCCTDRAGWRRLRSRPQRRERFWRRLVPRQL